MPNFVSYGPGVVKSDKRRGFFLASWQRDMSFLDGAVPNSPSHPCREFGEAPLAPGTGLLHFRLPSDQSHTCAGPAMVGSGGWGLSIRPIVQRPNLEGGGNGYRPQNQTHRLRPREGGFRSTLKERLKARTLYSQAPFLPGAFPFRAALLHSINRTEISADAQTSFFWAQCERSLWLNDSCVGDVGKERPRTGGTVPRLLRLSKSDNTSEVKHLAGSKTLRHATVQGLKH